MSVVGEIENINYEISQLEAKILELHKRLYASISFDLSTHKEILIYLSPCDPNIFPGVIKIFFL